MGERRLAKNNGAYSQHQNAFHDLISP